MTNADPLGPRRRAALERTDSLPPHLREVVHELGLPIVEAFLAVGVHQPNHMRHIARLFWTAASGQQNRTDGIRSHLDVMLLRNNGAPTSAALARLLHDQNLALLTRTPTARMVQASLEEHHRHGYLTPERKHFVRLRAALEEGARELWPDVFQPRPTTPPHQEPAA